MQASITEERPRAAGLDTTAITEALSQRIGSQKYKIWFQSCARFTVADGTLRIGVANPFLATWLEGHFLKDIQGAAQTVLGSVPEIAFTVDAELGGPQRRSAAGSGAAHGQRAIRVGRHVRLRAGGPAPARFGSHGRSCLARHGRGLKTDVGYVCGRLIQ